MNASLQKKLTKKKKIDPILLNVSNSVLKSHCYTNSNTIFLFMFKAINNLIKYVQCIYLCKVVFHTLIKNLFIYFYFTKHETIQAFCIILPKLEGLIKTSSTS